MRDVVVEGYASERLFTTHRMVSGGWWEVQTVDNNSSNSRSCLCRLMARKGQSASEESEVQLSPALLFHLTAGTTQGRLLQPTVSVLLRPYNPPLPFTSPSHPTSPPSSSPTSPTSPLPATLAVTLTRVCTPLSSGHARYDGAITRYFNQPRVVVQQQIIAVPLTARHTYIHAVWSDSEREAAEAEEEEVEEEESEQRVEEEQDKVVRDVRARLRSSASADVVFFRLTSQFTSSPYLFIEPAVTSISTEGSINTTAPHQLARYLTHSPLQSTTLLRTPLLSRQRSELYELIAPAVSGTAGQGGFALLVKASAHAMVEETVQSVASALGVHCLPLSLYTLLASPAFQPLSSSTAAATVPTVAYSSVLSFVTSCRPCLVHVRHLSALTAAKDSEKHIRSFLHSLISYSASSTDDSVVLVGECDDDDSVSVGVRGLFTHTYTVSAPDRDEREQVILAALSDESDLGSVDVEDRAEMARVVASKSAGVSVGELVGVVREGVRLGRRRWTEDEQQRRHALQRNTRHSTSASPSLPLASLPLILEPFTLTLPDLLASLSAYTARTSVLSGTLATLPTTRWSDIGGLTAAKRQIQQLIDLPRLSALSQPSTTTTTTTNQPIKPLKHVKSNSGILLFGPPGTGRIPAYCTCHSLSSRTSLACSRLSPPSSLLSLTALLLICRQDADGQSSRRRKWYEFYQCERTRATQHVRW